MARGKVKLALIMNASARKAALKKRRASLFKKAAELSILSDVKVSCIVYNPDEPNDPVVWPFQEQTQQSFIGFMNKSVIEQSRKRVTLESYLEQRIAKETERYNYKKAINDKKEAEEIMSQVFENGQVLQELDLNGLNNLYALAMDKLRKIEEKRRQKALHTSCPPPLLPIPPPQRVFIQDRARTTDEFFTKTEDQNTMLDLRDDQWLMKTPVILQDHEFMAVPIPSTRSTLGSNETIGGATVSFVSSGNK